VKFTKTLLSGLLLTALLQVTCAYANEHDDTLDRFRITELMYKYALYHNLTEPEEYASVFTEDGEFGPVKGRAALIAMAKDDRAKYNPGAVDGKRSFMVMRTIITNPVVTLNSDGTASGICYMQIVVQKKGVGPQILAQGRYEDKYRKEHGEWKIAHRDTFLDMTNMDLAKEIGVIK
jgi:SnoaL-like domain